jgi:hypothetical protein
LNCPRNRDLAACDSDVLVDNSDRLTVAGADLGQRLEPTLVGIHESRGQLAHARSLARQLRTGS